MLSSPVSVGPLPAADAVPEAAPSAYIDIPAKVAILLSALNVTNHLVEPKSGPTRRVVSSSYLPSHQRDLTRPPGPDLR